MGRSEYGVVGWSLEGQAKEFGLYPGSSETHGGVFGRGDVSRLYMRNMPLGSLQRMNWRRKAGDREASVEVQWKGQVPTVTGHPSDLISPPPGMAHSASATLATWLFLD